MKITTIGIDLAKNVFQLHGINAQGKTVLKKQLRRDAMLMFFVNLPPCRVGMEACGGAHYWARKLRSFGHDVKLMAPQFVKPYVKTNKNDEADAEAICEAVTRPNRGDRKDSLTFGNKPESYNKFDLYNRITGSTNERLMRATANTELNPVKRCHYSSYMSHKSISPFKVSSAH